MNKAAQARSKAESQKRSNGNAVTADVEPSLINLPAQPAIESSVDDEIAAVVGKIRHHQRDAELSGQQIHALKDSLSLLLEKRGSNWSDKEGYARLIASGVRTSYSTDALDALIINDPLRYGWLKDYRKESTVAGRIMVK